MHDDLGNAEPGTGLQFITEGGQTLVAGLARRGGQIDQVDIVGNDLVQSGGGEFLLEQARIGRADRLALPLVGVAGKDLQHAAAGGNRPVNGQVQAAGDGHVGTKVIVHAVASTSSI